jgi:hypothetical protein
MYHAKIAKPPDVQREACVDFSVIGENQTALIAAKNAY